MKDKWYADNRDLIKWGGIVHLCNETGIKQVYQIAYLRKYSWPLMEFNNRGIHIPDDVITHFRSIDDIARLSEKTGLNIHVVNREFGQNNRSIYNNWTCELIGQQTERKIVFLDPDTGLATENTKAKHVKPEEIYLVWQSLKRGDILVLYQHSFRDKNWKQIRKEQLAEACNLNKGCISEWSAPKIANDVVFFFCEK